MMFSVHASILIGTASISIDATSISTSAASIKCFLSSHRLHKVTEEAQHLKKLIQDYIASFIKVGDKGIDEKFKKRSEIGKMALISEKGGSLHTGGAISLVTRRKE
ncbi:hypothetical protein H5410_060612 [Solanum commersonii]|uniref:Uncharacterized protein n=1 Tax=Solanum commersonii TaxID=4109 RepID=A0A9J5W732_SOLCO|nr:hypothetical protein H5410_060612 [Solanum commersonii]